MSNKEVFVSNVKTIANVVALTKLAVSKLGFEYIAPMDEAIQNEKISKAVNSEIRRLED